MTCLLFERPVSLEVGSILHTVWTGSVTPDCPFLGHHYSRLLTHSRGLQSQAKENKPLSHFKLISPQHWMILPFKCSDS